MLEQLESVGTIYHWTSLEGIHGILYNNVLHTQNSPARGEAEWEEEGRLANVSFTRSSRTDLNLPEMSIRIVIDGDSLNTDHPLEEWGAVPAEEEVRTPAPISYIKGYIVQVELHVKNIGMSGDTDRYFAEGMGWVGEDHYDQDYTDEAVEWFKQFTRQQGVKGVVVP